MNTAELVPLLFCCFAFLAFLTTVLLVIFGSRLKTGALNVSVKAGGVEVNAAGGAFGVLAVVFGVLTWLTLPGTTAPSWSETDQALWESSRGPPSFSRSIRTWLGSRERVSR